ncbi:arsenate reductase (thioredoxin) [Sporolactobacillus shoreicorticis]|uniref:Arsenate reductase n=1 Tax=Sporolactobacillus shoreicorticis TaxID=1923877 RepID=A0ABW5S1M6_9BACL|nr:arsenate reductase (thioredoxin) [Sporolactobacillus shoreicorticis]MCO7126518.1 arsenate reductase (thioredoxin) [Sporolactobacillus shoreicorticis]
MKKLIYFLCTGNSCRSQMAEGFGKKYLSDDYDIRSAGIEAHGLNPNAVAVMKEVGIDISNHESKLIDLALVNRAYLVVTLCGDAEDRCPMTPPQIKREHWGFDDPAKVQGTPEEIRSVFQNVRDGIADKIKAFAEEDKITR